MKGFKLQRCGVFKVEIDGLVPEVFVGLLHVRSASDLEGFAAARLDFELVKVEHPVLLSVDVNLKPVGKLALKVQPPNVSPDDFRVVGKEHVIESRSLDPDKVPDNIGGDAVDHDIDMGGSDFVFSVVFLFRVFHVRNLGALEFGHGKEFQN